MSNLYEMAEQVNSKATLLSFVAALAADREAEVAKEADRPSPPFGRGANGWENGSIEAFLGAMAAWGAGNYGRIHGHTGEPHVPEEPSWQAFARILHAGKFYE